MERKFKIMSTDNIQMTVVIDWMDINGIQNHNIPEAMLTGEELTVDQITEILEAERPQYMHEDSVYPSVLDGMVEPEPEPTPEEQQEIEVDIAAEEDRVLDELKTLGVI